MTRTRLPIEDILETLKEKLCAHDQAVLQAPPGTGKTTVVPLALLDQPWLEGRKIIMLEPRRIATKAAAYRMASQLNESPGETVGYRMRLDSRISQQTRIEVMTEGVLTRMIQNDPSMQAYGLVIFDEFHERSLDSDLALALSLQGRELFRDGHNPLKILVMSATIDTASIAALLDNAPVINCKGKSHAVDIIYGRARHPQDRVVDRVVATVKLALDENPGDSVLAFLPGQGEIHRAAEQIGDWLAQNKIGDILLYPLYGNLSVEDQQKAIEPVQRSQRGTRKVVLATNIAETSLTIEGVNIIVDCGLAREPRFNPATAMSGLETVRISATSAKQRAGRAGRTAPGKCYRLWSAQQQQQLAPHTSAEILNADLAPLALQLLSWGVDNPDDLKWLDPPPRGAWLQALGLLKALGAVESKSGSMVLSSHGEIMASIGIHPRLAHLLICGAGTGYLETSCLLASLLSERGTIDTDNADIQESLDLLTGDSRFSGRHQGRLHRIQQQARQYQQQLKRQLPETNLSRALGREQLCGYLLACAYPDRVARRRHAGGYQLANGRSARFAAETHLAKQQWLAVFEVTSTSGGRGDIIRSAAELDKTLFSTLLSDLVESTTITQWDRKKGIFIAEQQQKIGALILRSSPLDNLPKQLKVTALIETIRSEGLDLLPWKPEHRQWLARVELVRANQNPDEWPDLSFDTLLANLENWLAPYLNRVNTLKSLNSLDLSDILNSMLNWNQQMRLNELAPARIEVPSGSLVKIDYTESPPVLAVKLQEMFGCRQGPSVVNGKVAVNVHLLSPAGRPLQITSDLAGFWQNSYHQVKKEMKGRYPKHPWPDDPMTANPTRHTKKQKK